MEDVKRGREERFLSDRYQNVKPEKGLTHASELLPRSFGVTLICLQPQQATGV